MIGATLETTKSCIYAKDVAEKWVSFIKITKCTSVKNVPINQEWLENKIAQILRHQFEPDYNAMGLSEDMFLNLVRETSLVIAGVIMVELKGDNNQPTS